MRQATRVPKVHRAGPTVRFVALVVVGVLTAAAVAITVDDYRSNRAIVTIESTVANATDTGEVHALQRLAAGQSITLADVAPALEFVRGENDGADFRLITLTRILHGYGESLTPEVAAEIERVLADTRYWMDEPGVSPVFYGSENHQILTATSELLAGQRLPDLHFRDGRTGTEHAADARERVLFWLEQRWRFGFSEWNSHYYGQDIAALANLVDFAADDEISRKAEIVLDVVLFEMASQSFRGEFIAASARLYGANKMIGDAGIHRIIQHAFGAGVDPMAEAGIEINFLLSGYSTPAVLRAIANDTADVVIRSSSGRDLDELGSDTSIDSAERRIMALWGMQAFTNPEAIADSLNYIDAHDLFVSPYLAPFKQLNYRLLRGLGLLPLISTALDLPSNGLVIERADVYTYRTADALMSTAQSYAPGTFGNQQHVFGVTLGVGTTIFHTHPAVLDGDPMPNGNSPGYWTGSGILPVSCQAGPVNLSLYRIPENPGFGREYVLDFTHLSAPLDRADRFELDGNTIVMQYGDALVGVIAGAPLEQASDRELIQRGLETYWITEVSSTTDEDFVDFAERIRGAEPSVAGGALTYRSDGLIHGASLEDGCSVDGEPASSGYDRHASPYAQVEREAQSWHIEFNGQWLDLDFEALSRRVGEGASAD
jgi:hypothetical protein